MHRLAKPASVLLAVVAVACSSMACDPPIVIHRSGEPRPTFAGDERWQLVLDEGFDGSSLRSGLWRTCHWWADDTGCQIGSSGEQQWYRPEQVEVRAGALRLTADARPTFGFPYVSGMVSSGPASDDSPAGFDFRFGAVEARVRLPRGRGLWPAVWMLPSSTSSRPEIDILEMYGHLPDEMRMHVHWWGDDGSKESDGRISDGVDLTDGWHDVGIRWWSGGVTWFRDGVEQWTVDGVRVPDEPMYLVLNLAVGGERAGDPDDPTVFPAEMAVDWVRVWLPGPEE